MTVQIAEGAESTRGEAPNIVIHDHGYSLIEPILKRRLANYHPMTRWGVLEAPTGEWLAAVPDLRALAERLRAESPAGDDVEWIHSVDLDLGAETDTSDFLSAFADPAVRGAAVEMLNTVADWLEVRARQLHCMTIFGY